jgi:PhnB protein
MEYYKECLGGELDLQTVGQSPMASSMGEDSHNKVLHSAIMKDGKMIMMASDMVRGTRTVGDNVDLCLVCDTKEEINELFTKLSEDGEQTAPLKEEFFGTFGEVVDKFGFRWMLQFGTGGQKS